jgi:hypothetical protein
MMPMICSTPINKCSKPPRITTNRNTRRFRCDLSFEATICGSSRNVPLPELSVVERAEIEKKASEIETGKRTEDVDEDDSGKSTNCSTRDSSTEICSGVKRPSENYVDDGNSNTRNTRANRTDFLYDNDYNPSRSVIWSRAVRSFIHSFGHSRRGNMRDQRGGGNNNNRRGGGNNPKQNQYTSSRSNEQSNYNNRPQQQYNSRGARGNRYPDNRPSYEGRKSPSQTANDESSRPQRMNSGNHSHGQVSGPTSPSTAVPARTIYSNNRHSGSRNSPAPYTGSSSSRNNSISTTSPPPNQASNNNNNNNKMGKKPPRSKID